ncbi:MAG: TraB/GumN family protein [Paracoccaceae bacterium]
MDALPPESRADLTARTDTAPFAQGNYWRATKDGAAVTIIGTYHLGDPRHAETLAAITPAIEAASTVLVEAGPEEEEALKDHLLRDPSLMMIMEGPTLLEQLPPEDWARLEKAMMERQVPGFLAAKFQPWYVSVLLSMPPCAMEGMAAKDGLDFGVMDAADAAQVPVRALEPYDTVLRLFDKLPAVDQIEMVQNSLLMDESAEDMSITLADAYFDENSRVIWELLQDKALELPGYTPERVEEEFATMEEALINGRNRGWIPVIEDAAADGPVFAAFGALHLSGDEGVLNLLAQKGWTLERLPL